MKFKLADTLKLLVATCGEWRWTPLIQRIFNCLSETLCIRYTNQGLIKALCLLKRVIVIFLCSAKTFMIFFYHIQGLVIIGPKVLLTSLILSICFNVSSFSMKLKHISAKNCLKNLSKIQSFILKQNSKQNQFICPSNLN